MDHSTYVPISQVHCAMQYCACTACVCTYTAKRILVHVVSSDHLTNQLPLSIMAGQQEAVQATLCRQTQEQRRKEADSNTHTCIHFAIKVQITEDRMEYCHVSLAAVLYLVAFHAALDMLDYCIANIFKSKSLLPT